MIHEIKPPAAVGTGPVTNLKVTKSYNRALIAWEPPMQHGETDQAVEIIDSNVKYYMVYIKEGDAATYVCHGIVYPPLSFYVVHNRAEFYDSFNKVTARVYAVDTEGRKSAHTQDTSDAMA